MSEWTTALPTEPGYYWRRISKHYPISEIILVTCNEAGILVGSRYDDDECPYSVAIYGGEWWPEPIQEPPK